MHTDPDSISDIICLHTGAPLNGIAAFDLNNGSKIDIGKYSHVVLLAVNGGGTTAATVTITPKDTDSQTGPEFPLDGTGGVPDLRRTFSSQADLGSRQVVIRTAGRRRFLNVEIALSATGTVRVALYLICYGKRQSNAQPIDTNLAALGVS